MSYIFLCTLLKIILSLLLLLLQSDLVRFPVEGMRNRHSTTPSQLNLRDINLCDKNLCDVNQFHLLYWNQSDNRCYGAAKSKTTSKNGFACGGHTQLLSPYPS